ncbi:TetR/AcrR family transcriptional regulator [Nocardia sp. NPDC058633]|uniref:TetR/AcrR family transcriptional regulator n=1 Tax=Nocardia sp. NPDC058633 TaxID=3346568 RepID=UPI003657ED3F
MTEISGSASRDERRPEVERRLIAAVSDLCAGGALFADLSVSRIVRTAAIGRATFYLYFPDRSAFVLRLVDHVRAELAGSVAAVWRAAGDRGALEAALADFVEIYAREYPLITAVVDASGTDAQVAQRMEANLGLFIEESARTIVAAQQRGTVRGEVPAEETAAALVWMVERTCYRVIGGSTEKERARLNRALTMIIWHSLHPEN